VVFLALFYPVPAFAVSTVPISPAGGGIFLLQGSGIENAASLEITVSYDTTTLTNLRGHDGDQPECPRDLAHYDYPTAPTLAMQFSLFTNHDSLQS